MKDLDFGIMGSKKYIDELKEKIEIMYKKEKNVKKIVETLFPKNLDSFQKESIQRKIELFFKA